MYQVSQQSTGSGSIRGERRAGLTQPGRWHCVSLRGWHSGLPSPQKPCTPSEPRFQGQIVLRASICPTQQPILPTAQATAAESEHRGLCCKVVISTSNPMPTLIPAPTPIPTPAPAAKGATNQTPTLTATLTPTATDTHTHSPSTPLGPTFTAALTLFPVLTPTVVITQGQAVPSPAGQTNTWLCVGIGICSLFLLMRTALPTAVLGRRGRSEVCAITHGGI